MFDEVLDSLLLPQLIWKPLLRGLFKQIFYLICICFSECYFQKKILEYHLTYMPSMLFPCWLIYGFYNLITLSGVGQQPSETWRSKWGLHWEAEIASCTFKYLHFFTLFLPPFLLSCPNVYPATSTFFLSYFQKETSWRLRGDASWEKTSRSIDVILQDSSCTLKNGHHILLIPLIGRINEFEKKRGMGGIKDHHHSQ